MRRLLHVLGLIGLLLAGQPATAQVSPRFVAIHRSVATATAPAFSPSSILAKIPVWFEADVSSLALSGSAVTGWTNKGSQGSVADDHVDGAGARPAKVAAALGSYDAVSFDGSNDNLQTGAINLSGTNITIWLVVKRISATLRYDGIISMNMSYGTGLGIEFAAAGQDWSDNQLIAFGGEGFGAGNGSRAYASDAAVTDNAWHVWQIELGGAGAIKVGGVLTSDVSLTNAFAAITGQAFRIGGYDPGQNYIREVIICADCTSGEKASMNTYLARYGLPS